MPTIGGVHVPDELMPRIDAPSRARPSLSSIFGGAAEGTVRQIAAALPLQFETLTRESVDPGLAFNYQQDLARAGEAFSRAAPANVSDLTSGRVGIGRFAVENLTASLPQMLGIAAGGLAGGAAGGPAGAVAGAVAAGTPMFSASNVARAVEENGSLDTAAAERSLGFAPFQAAADAALLRFLPGAGKVLGDAAATQAGGFIRRTATSMAKAGATEAVTEASQQIGERAAAGIPIGTPDAVAEYVNAGVTAFAVGGMLGAGGGFRRTNATAKPADMVTEDDINELVDGTLNGELRALPPPADFIGGADGQTRVNPAGTTQLALPSPDMFPRTDVVADAAGRAQPANQPLADLTGQPTLSAMPTILANLPRTPEAPLELGDIPNSFEGNRSEELNAILQGRAPVTDGDLALEFPGRFALAEPFGGGTRPFVEPGTVDLSGVEFRPFQSDSLEDIQKAINSKRSAPSLVAAAQEELARRDAEAIGAAPLTAENFQQRVDELKRGLRGGFVQKLEATSPQDLLDKVYDEIFVNANTQAHVQKFAQRLGILDENLEPGPEAEKVEARRAEAILEGDGTASLEPVAGGVGSPTSSAPPASTTQGAASGSRTTEKISTAETTAETQAEMKAAMKAAGIKRLSAATSGRTLNTPADVMLALAEPDALGGRGTNAAVTQVEKMARKLGLVTDDDAMDVTPKGRRVFLQSVEGPETIVAAAQEQGFTGAAASQFERGARVALGGEPQTQFAGFEEMAAHEAGRVWAQDYINNGETRTAAQTQAIMARQEARPTGRAVPRQEARGEASRRLTPQQVQQQSLNRLIDAADLRTASDSDVAELRRMVRDGATAADVGRAIQNVQAGRSLFEEGPRQPLTMQPARPMRRAQPAFVEMNTRSEPTRRQMRAETELAVEANDLRNLIQFALAEKGITKKRAEKLHALLDQGKVEQVRGMMKDFDPGDAVTAFGDRRGAPRADGGRRGEPRSDDYLGYADAAFEQAIDGKSFMEVLDHMVEEAPSAYHRQVMRGVRGLIRKLERAGTQFDFRVLKEGDTVPRDLIGDDSARAYTELWRVPPRVEIGIKSVSFGPEAGMNYQVVAHEMIHAATMMLVDFYKGRAIAPNDKLGQAVKDLEALAEHVLNHFYARMEAGQLNAFEEKFYRHDSNALVSADEVLAWGLTNPDMQRYLASIEYKPRQSVWSRFVDLLRRVIGLGESGIEFTDSSALAELLRVSERVMGAENRDLLPVFMRNRFEARPQGTLIAAASEAAVSARNRTVEASNEVTKGVAAMVDQVVNNLNVADLGVRARRVALGWLSANQLVRQFGRVMPALAERNAAHGERIAVRSRFEQMGDEAYQAFEKLERENPKAAKLMGELMATTTEFQLDPDKTWEQHTHLQNNTNAAALKRLHGEVVEMRNKLRRGDGQGWTAFNQFRALNEAQNYARMAAGLHSLVAMDPELALGVEGAMVNPVDQFMKQDLTSATAIRDWWHQALQQQIAASVAFVNAKKGEAAEGTENDQLAMRQHLSPIELQISAIHEALAASAKAPYFHLGRFGDHFGSAVVAKQADGTADPEALKKLAAALEKAGFDDVQISTDNTRPRFMLRFDTVDQRRRFEKLALQLQKDGVLSASDEIKAGPRNLDKNFGVAEGLPDYVARYIQSIEASPMFVPDETMSDKERALLEQRKQEAVRLALDTWLEQQPDSSISKVLVKRYTVPGYNKDMVRNWAHRWRVGSISLANVAASPKFNRAYINMRSQVNEAMEVREGDRANVDLLGSLMSEMKVRDAAAPVEETADTFDKARAYAHSYFLGMSPAYGLINMTQMGVVALPELAKKHGYSKSFHALRRASATSFKILKAVAAEARQLGPKHYADVAITSSVLEKAGLSAEERNFALQMLATGKIDIGSAARALGQIAENRVGSKTDVALKYASAIGQYTETFSRLTTALAARDLSGGSTESAVEYAADVVSNAMFDYPNWNTARQLGKRGFLGPVTPIVTQFMSYSVQITEKLYSEVAAAARRRLPNESEAEAKQRRLESRRFLLGHLTAVTALAGSLGLPFATVFATVIERLVDAFDDDEEPYDATAAWRGFMADVFGTEVAEVVSRGLPRALGFDISARAGEQNLFPFSEFLADRRPWKEAVETYTGRSLGAVPSMFSNIVTGGGKIADGDLLGGMKDVLPVAFKGPIEAYRMTAEGYVDSRGNKLPLSPGASSYLWQLLGFSSAEKAEYSEARGDQAARRGEITRRATRLRQQIIKAMVEGDNAKAAELVSDAQKFDADNPAFAVIPSLAGSLQRQMTARSRAAALQTPLGVGINDIAGQGMTRYANVNVTQ